MTKYVILGHGGFNPESGSFLPEVLVPPDTALQFWSDAGQVLRLPYLDDDADYSTIAPAWNQLKDQGSPIQPKGVTYNFTLYPGESAEEVEGAKRANWGSGVQIEFISSGTTYLCTGTADTCPTPKLNVAAARHVELAAKGDAAIAAFKTWLDGVGGFPPGIADFESRLADLPVQYVQYVAGGVPDERWKHHCEGILGRLGGKGNELYWIACTSFEIATPELPVLVTADVSGPGSSDISDWEPDDDAYEEIRAQNAKALNSAAASQGVAIVAGGKLVLIGEGHPRRPAGYVSRQSQIEEGLIKVTKGGAFSKSAIEVTGIETKQAIVESEIGKVSDKNVTFV